MEAAPRLSFPITPEEILRKAGWDGKSAVIQFLAYSHVFEKDVRFTIHVDGAAFAIVPAKTLQAVNEFLDFDAPERKVIDDAIWANCLLCHHPPTAYAAGSDRWLAAKMEQIQFETGIASRAEAIARTRVSEVYVNPDVQPESRVINLVIKTDWDLEHGFTMIYENGVHVATND